MFYRNFALYSILLFAGLYGLIIAVDPYDKYGFNPFNFTSKAVMQGRDNKFRMIESSTKNYELFLLGSSSAHRFKVEDLNYYSGMTSFNYALQHTSPEDYYAIVGHILARAKPKLLLLQMDFEAMNKNFEVDNRLYNSQLKQYLKGKKENQYFSDTGAMSTYLTLDAIRDTFKVIGVNLFGKPLIEYEADGNYPKEPRPKGEKVALVQSSYGTYHISDARIELLRQIKHLCQDRGIKLIVFTTPYSAAHLVEISKQGLDDQVVRFKNVLVEVFGEIYDFTNDSVRLIDSHDYFMDSAHPSPLLSKLMLEKIFTGKSRVPSEAFGRKISIQNLIKAH